MAAPGSGFMTGVIRLEDHARATKYTAMAPHEDEEDFKKHEAMGFHDGWSTVLDRLVEFIKSQA